MSNKYGIEVAEAASVTLEALLNTAAADTGIDEDICLTTANISRIAFTAAGQHTDQAVTGPGFAAKVGDGIERRFRHGFLYIAAGFPPCLLNGQGHFLELPFTFSH